MDDSVHAWIPLYIENWLLMMTVASMQGNLVGTAQCTKIHNSRCNRPSQSPFKVRGARVAKIEIKKSNIPSDLVSEDTWAMQRNAVLSRADPG
jgi:hypothetical protein